MTTGLRSVENLIAAFPNLGRTGAEAEAKAALEEAGTRYQFLDDAFSDAETIAAVKLWSVNNTPMVSLSEAEFAKGVALARRDAIMERSRCPEAWQTAPGDIPAAAAAWVDIRLGAIDAMERAGRAFSELDRLYRGAAMPSDLFNAEFRVGEKICWRRLTACTLDPDFTPIHYAWKQHAELMKAGAPRDVTSFILEVRLGAQPLPPLVWTGAVVGGFAASTYRWQMEVVAPPGFEFKVISIEEQNLRPQDRLVRVRAEYVPPGA